MKHKMFKVLLGGIVIGSILYVLFMYYIWHPEKGIRYFFPEKYRGWICITYNAKNTPPLRKEEGFLVVTVPPNGIVRTSSSPNTYDEEGYYVPTYDEYYYYDENGTKHAESLAQGGGYTVQMEHSDELTSYFWISTKKEIQQDYEMYVKNRDVLQLPPCGPWTKTEDKKTEDKKTKINPKGTP